MTSPPTPPARRRNPVPSRVVTGTIVAAGTERQESVVRRGMSLLIRSEMVIAGIGLVGVMPVGGIHLLLSTLRLVGPVLGVLALFEAAMWLARPSDTARVIDMVRLVVKDVHGVEFTCEARGTLSTAPAHGAMVDVHGRRTGEQSASIRLLVIVGSGTVITVRTPAMAVLVGTLSMLIALAWTAVVGLIAWQILSTN